MSLSEYLMNLLACTISLQIIKLRGTDMSGIGTESLRIVFPQFVPPLETMMTQKMMGLMDATSVDHMMDILFYCNELKNFLRSSERQIIHSNRRSADILLDTNEHSK